MSEKTYYAVVLDSDWGTDVEVYEEREDAVQAIVEFTVHEILRIGGDLAEYQTLLDEAACSFALSESGSTSWVHIKEVTIRRMKS